MVFGLTDSGFIPKRTADIKTELEESLKSSLGDGINLEDESDMGHIVGILADRNNFIWEQLENLNNSSYPDTAEGASLDDAVTLTGTNRNPTTSSKVTVRVFGIETTAITLPFVLSVAGNPTARFAADAGAVIGPAVDEVQDIDFSGPPSSGSMILDHGGNLTSPILFSDGAAVVESELEGLASIGVGNVTVTGDFTAGFTVTFGAALAATDVSPITVDTNTLDGGLTVITIAETVKGGPPHVDVAFTAENPGPVAAPINSLTVIETPQVGVGPTDNFAAALLGRNTETDPDLKVRRIQTFKRAGTATVEGIRHAVLLVEFVSQVLVRENDDIVVDVDGIPPKAFETFVQGGVDEDIVAAIFASKPAGIEAHGDTIIPIIDSQGFSHDIGFSRPVTKEVWLEVDITKRTDATEGPVYPADGDTQVKAALLAFGADFRIGQDVIVPELVQTIMNGVQGVLTIVIRLGFAPAPVGTANLAIAAVEIAELDSSRILVVSI